MKYQQSQSTLSTPIQQLIMERRVFSEILQHLWALIIIIYNNYMLAYLLLAALLGLLHFFHRYYFKPMAEIKRYASIFKSLGYSVYQHKFSFLGVSFGDDWKTGETLHRDALYIQKNVYTQVDISIGNILDKVHILLVNPDLVQSYLSPTAIWNYPKYMDMILNHKQAFGQGLAFSQGDLWKAKKKILSKAFTYELVKDNLPMICSICDRWFDQFDRKHKMQGNKVQYDLRHLAAKIANGVVVKCFLGVDQPKEEEQSGVDYEQLVVNVIEEAGLLSFDPVANFFGIACWHLGLTKQIRKLKKSVAFMWKKSEQILQKRKAEIEKAPKLEKDTDIIQALLDHNKSAGKSDFIYTDRAIICELQTFLLAGTEVIAHYFNMMIYLIAKHPQVERKLREQVNSVIKTSQDINHQNLKKLTYIDWISSETTRYYGPAIGNLERVALEDNYILDLPIKKGTVVNFQPVGSHFSIKHFKDPFQFRPERWESECDSLHPFAFIGFSAGPRTCIGKQLALLQVKISLVKLIKRYESIKVPEDVVMIMTFSYEPEPFETIFEKATQRRDS